MRREVIRSFAEEKVRSTLIDRYKNRVFSRDLWSEMAEMGLFRFLVPAEYGGSNGGPASLVEAVDAFLVGGHDLGLCLSWLDHLLIHTHVIVRFGSPEQKSRFLPSLVGGQRIGAMAASEPGNGADPSKMKARAEEDNDTYRIWGEKIFITNGPVADFVIVLARTGPGKEGISAFLVETSSPGFRVRKEMDFGFLNTSPHGELVFEDCPVPKENLLGGLGEGHIRISRAVFAWERYLLLVALIVHFRVLFRYVLKHLCGTRESLSDTVRREIALMHVTLDGLGDIAGSLASEVLARTSLDRRLHERLLFLGSAVFRWRSQLDKLLLGAPNSIETPLLSILLKDAKLLNVNQRLAALQLERVATQLLQGTEEEGQIQADQSNAAAGTSAPASLKKRGHPRGRR